MCKHILNTQCYIRAHCCSKWYECSECHDEREDHKFQTSRVMRFTCKNCRGCFEIDFLLFPDSDKKCKNCQNLWCIPGVTPESKMLDESMNSLDTYLKQLISPEENKIFEVKKV